MVKKQASY